VSADGDRLHPVRLVVVGIERVVVVVLLLLLLVHD